MTEQDNRIMDDEELEDVTGGRSGARTPMGILYSKMIKCSVGDRVYCYVGGERHLAEVIAVGFEGLTVYTVRLIDDPSKTYKFNGSELSKVR